jgi:hypothetical protein
MGAVMSEQSNEVKSMGGAPAAAKKARWKSILKGLVIFISGAVIGSALTVHVGHRLMFEALGHPDRMAERFTKRLRRELNLSDVQTGQVRRILNKHAEEVSRIMEETRPRMEEQFEMMHAEVSTVLDEDQKIKWDEHYEKMKQRFDRHVPPPPLPR